MRVQFKANPQFEGTVIGEVNDGHNQSLIVKLDRAYYIAQDILINTIVIPSSAIVQNQPKGESYNE